MRDLVRAMVVLTVCVGILGCDPGGSAEVRSAKQTTDGGEAAEATTYRYACEGMVCTNCEDAIVATAKGVEGVVGCEASHTEGTVVIIADSPTAAKEAAERIAGLNYRISQTGD